MEPVKVPQHLELDDVIAWGLGAVDLIFVAAGSLIGWWVWEFVPTDIDIRTALAAPFVVTGLALGVVRCRSLTLREWAVLAGSFAVRARLLLLRGDR